MAETIRKFDSTRKRPRNSVRQQIVELETQSKQTLSSLDVSCQTLRSLEDQLAEFMDDYYTQTGPYVDELVALEQELAGYRQKKPISNDNLAKTKQIIRETEDKIRNKTQNRQIERDIKGLYRDMVKECHPDTAAGEEAVEEMKREAMQVINDAYARKSLADMWNQYVQMEIKMSKGVRGKAKLERLQARIDQMRQALDEVENRRLTLEQSAACALMNRAFEMRLSGKSLTDQIINETIEQINATRKKIAYHHMKQKLMDEADTMLKEGRG